MIAKLMKCMLFENTLCIDKMNQMNNICRTKRDGWNQSALGGRMMSLEYSGMF